MTKVRLCTGEYAEKPYYLNTVCTNVYGIEELCYLFALNPFMITQDVMNLRLVDWIETECKLKELADELRPLFRKGSQLFEFINIILNYVNYCDEAELASIDETLKDNSGLSEMERKKRQADYLLKSGRIMSAIEEYENLLSILPDVESALRPKVYQNMGYAYAQLFMFDVAAKYYKRSYDLSGDEEMAIEYLAALRLFFSEDKYIQYISEHAKFHNASLLLEKKVRTVLEDFEGSRESIMLNALNIYKDDGNVASYYEQIDNVIAGMKEDYIKQVVE